MNDIDWKARAEKAEKETAGGEEQAVKALCDIRLPGGCTLSTSKGGWHNELLPDGAAAILAAIREGRVPTVYHIKQIPAIREYAARHDEDVREIGALRAQVKVLQSSLEAAREAGRKAQQEADALRGQGKTVCELFDVITRERVRHEQALALLREWRDDDGIPSATRTSKRGRTDAFLDTSASSDPTLVEVRPVLDAKAVLASFNARSALVLLRLQLDGKRLVVPRQAVEEHRFAGLNHAAFVEHWCAHHTPYDIKAGAPAGATHYTDEPGEGVIYWQRGVAESFRLVTLSHWAPGRNGDYGWQFQTGYQPHDKLKELA